MKCYQCGKELSRFKEPVKLISPEGEEVHVHEFCLCFIEVDNNGVIK